MSVWVALKVAALVFFCVRSSIAYTDKRNTVLYVINGKNRRDHEMKLPLSVLMYRLTEDQRLRIRDCKRRCKHGV